MASRHGHALRIGRRLRTGRPAHRQAARRMGTPRAAVHAGVDAARPLMHTERTCHVNSSTRLLVLPV